MITVKFVFGICDDHLKECLLREIDISLHKLVGLPQRTEPSKQHIKEMTKATTKPMMLSIRITNRDNSCVGSVVINTGLKNSQHLVSNAHKLNHFAKVCHNKYNTRRQITDNKSTAKKIVHAVDQEDNTLVIEDELEVFINALQVHGLSETSWLSTVSIEGGKITSNWTREPKQVSSH